MPLYDYRCGGCKNEFEMSHGMHASPAPCPHCGSTNISKIIKTAPAVKPPVDAGWEGENDGRGRYISQIADDKPGKPDPDAFCRSQDEIIEKGKRKGLKVKKAR